MQLVAEADGEQAAERGAGCRAQRNQKNRRTHGPVSGRATWPCPAIMRFSACR